MPPKFEAGGETVFSIYGDESGSISKKGGLHNRYFVVALVKVNNAQALKRAYKRFISSNMEELKKADKKKNKMFTENGDFHELKGFCLTPELKTKFVDFFTRKPHFDLFYIVMDNTKTKEAFYRNTARNFNYLIQKSISCFRNRKLLPDEGFVLQLDERNERTEARFFLENYLNTQLVFEEGLDEECRVLYFDSSANSLVQVADVFANLMYSHLITGDYKEEIQKLWDAKMLKMVFKFPLTNN